MADSDRNPRRHAVGPHADHDLLLIAARAAGDAEGVDRTRADALIAGCAECAGLAGDLRSIAQSTAQLPMPRRSRDFSLRPEDAERLRPRGIARVLRGLTGRPVRPIGALRPVAAGLTAIGLAGLLVATLPAPATPLAGSDSGARSAAEAAPSDSDHQPFGEASAAPAASAAASGGPLLTSSGSAGKTPGTEIAGDGGGGDGVGIDGVPPKSPLVAVGPILSPGERLDGGDAETLAVREASGPSAWVIGSLVLVVGGVTLFAASVARERRRVR